MPTNKEYVASVIDGLMDHFGDQLVFDIFLETWEPLESIRDAVDAKIDKRDYKKRRNRIRYNRRDIILALDENKCQYCGKYVEGKEAEIDHILPLEKGGNEELENQVTSCTRDNKGMGTSIKSINPRNIEARRRVLIESGAFGDVTYEEFKEQFEGKGKVRGRDRFKRTDGSGDGESSTGDGEG
jgi:hypothetical protein